MAKIMPFFPQQFFDDNGEPLSGGKIYTYEAGTTTQKATYTTQAGTTEHDNPVELDASGRPDNNTSIWLGSGAYKIIIKDADGITLDTIDDVNSESSTALDGVTVNSISDLKNLTSGEYDAATVLGYYFPGDNGGGLFYYDADDTTTSDGGIYIKPNDVSTGRWIRVVEGNEVDVKLWGAKGNGTHDDKQYFVYANAYADDNNKSIGLSGGTYLIGSDPELTVPVHFYDEAIIKITETTFNMDLTPILNTNDLQQHFICSGADNTPVFPKGTVITPYFFGAAGDNTANDTGFFEQAIYSLETNGGTLRIPSNPTGYLVGSIGATLALIPLVSNVDIIGDGLSSIINIDDSAATDAGVFGSAVEVTNVSIKNLTLNLNKANNTSGMVVNAIIDGGEISGCWFENTYTDGLELSCTNFAIKDNTFKNCGDTAISGGAISLVDGDYVDIFDNEIISDDSGASYAINVLPTSGIANLSIKDNKITGCGIFIDGSTSSADVVEVINNVINQEIYTNSTSGLSIDTAESVRINNNVITVDATIPGIVVEDVTLSDISGNTIRATSESASYAISFSGTNTISCGFNYTTNFPGPNSIPLNTISDTRLGFSDYSQVVSAGEIALNKGFINRLTGSTALNLISKDGWRDGGIALLVIEDTVTISHNYTPSGNYVPVMFTNAINNTFIPGDSLCLRYEYSQFHEVFIAKSTVNRIRSGTAIISSGSATVLDDTVTTDTVILLTEQTSSPYQGIAFSVDDKSTGSFKIKAPAGDTSSGYVVGYLLIG